MPDKKLPAVPETILKRRKRQAESRAARAKATLLAKRQRRAKRVEVFKRAEKYAKEYRDKERDDIRLRRDARKNDGYHVPAEPKLAFVIRIRGINQARQYVDDGPNYYYSATRNFPCQYCHFSNSKFKFVHRALERESVVYELRI